MNLVGESTLHSAMMGMFAYEASQTGCWSALGSEMRSSLGSLKAACAWLVKAPGVNRPAIDEQPMYLANLSTALCAMGLLATTNTSSGFSTAAIALAASTSFSQVFFRLMMLTPSVFFLKMYCSMVVSLLSEPMWVQAASIFVTSSSPMARAAMPPDILDARVLLKKVNQA